MTRDPGPDNRLPEQIPPRKAPPTKPLLTVDVVAAIVGCLLAVLLCLAFADPVHAASRLERRGTKFLLMPPGSSPVTIACPTGYVCHYPDAIMDGPDGFPNEDTDCRGRGMEYWRWTPTGPVLVLVCDTGWQITDDSDPWVEGQIGEDPVPDLDPDDEVAVERPIATSVCDTDACVQGCQDSTGECEAKRKETCATKHPNARTASQHFSRVTKYEEGKACEFTCVTSDGDLKLYSCERQKKRAGGGGGTAALMP